MDDCVRTEFFSTENITYTNEISPGKWIIIKIGTMNFVSDFSMEGTLACIEVSAIYTQIIKLDSSQYTPSDTK